MKKKKISVYVADDHKILIDGIIALLETESNIEVIGYSLTGKSVLDWYQTNTSDVLILDINMPELDGIEVLKAFKNRNEKHKTIILSSFNDPKLVNELISLGASGFIEKSSASNDIITAIHTVYEGGRYFSKKIQEDLLNLLVDKSTSERKIQTSIENPLSKRELEILELIIEEYSSNEIAQKLNLSIKTIEFHRKNLYRKLNVKSLVGLAKYAVKNNIV